MNKQKISYALAFAAFLGSAALSPVFADDMQVVGNGAFTNNQVQANSQSSTNVSQTNTTQAANTVSVSNNTGNNSANFNTGSAVSMNTGAANGSVGVSNNAGSNVAQVAGGSQGGQDTAVAANGAFSDSTVTNSNTTSTSLSQNNQTNFANTVTVDNNTGKNSADFNTGGSVAINTAPANAMVGVSNNAGSNQAAVSGGSANSTGTNTVVAGNGAFGSTDVSGNSTNSTSLNQQNDTNIHNTVNASNNTGKNSADFNTDSNVSINTGSANAWVGVSNTAGQNVGFVVGGSGGGNGSTSVIGNGAFSNNTVSGNNSLKTDLEQQNLTYVVNYIDTMNNTGNNAVSFNTGGSVDLTTGDANSGVTVFNTAGSNEGQVISPTFFANAALTAIFGNGAFSETNVNSNENNSTSVHQKNNTSLVNTVSEKNNSGNNKADFGTSFLSGMAMSQSGNANAQVGLYNLASANFLSY